METHLTYCFDERKHIRFTHRPAPAVNADGTYRLNASASDCDEKYQSSQEKLYPATQWKVAGNTITTWATHFAVGQTCSVAISGNRMTWTSTEGQGTLVVQR